MHFTCNKCKYTFEAADVQELCPDCGMIAVRKATEEEIKVYRQYRQLFDREEDEDSHERKVFKRH